MQRIKFTAQHPSERDDERRRQKNEKSTAFNRRNKYGGSRYRNVKRGVKENRKAQQKPGGCGGEGEQRRGPWFPKRLSFTYERKKRAKEKLLLASWTQCQTQSVSGLAALLVSQAPAHNGGEPGPPHLSLQICILQDRPESKGAVWRDDKAPQTFKFS